MKILYLVGAALVAAMTWPLAAIAQDGQTAITTTPPAETVCQDCPAPQAFIPPMPPANFNPVTASDAALAHYGFPPRPNAATAPDDYAFWRHLVTLPAKRVNPTLRATKVYNGPAQIGPLAARSANGPTGTSSNNWSGYAIVDGKNPFKATNTYVYGAFVVPTARQAFGACKGTVYSSSWVGIDGFNSSDVFQAGIEADATCSANKTTAYYTAWYEWFPISEIAISSPPVAPGNLIYVYIWNVSQTQGWYYMANDTQNVYSTLEFKAPKGTKLTGNSVEWIVERPGIGGSLSNLMNYTAIPWYYARAANSARGSLEYSPGTAPTGTLYSITMIDSSSNEISQSYATPESALTYVNEKGAGFHYAGSALWFFDVGSAK